MFNAQAARALSQRPHSPSPEALLRLKNCILAAAEASQSFADVLISPALEVRSNETPSPQELITLLRSSSQPEAAMWAYALSQALLAGYDITLASNSASPWSLRVDSFRISWHTPHHCAADCHLMSATTAEQLMEAASAVNQWAQTPLALVQAAARAGRSELSFRDPLQVAHPSWNSRMQLLKRLGFQVTLTPSTEQSRVGLRW